jgi:hypothetical protein
MAIHLLPAGVFAHSGGELLYAWLKMLGLSCFTGIALIAAVVAVLIWKSVKARRLERLRIESLVRELHRDKERPPGID